MKRWMPSRPSAPWLRSPTKPGWPSSSCGSTGMAGLPAGVTAGPLAIAPPALSFHLKALTHAGLLVQQHAANFFALAEAKARADRWPVQYSILNASILGRVGSAQADERM
ncbi:MAG: helix-turn-helix transcriptional regulator, partial [Rhodoferax sp.]|nr:helix-turn-helix transcriptional regulator [Rhodoferax sp.]